MGCGALSGQSDTSADYACDEENLPMHLRKGVTVLKGNRASEHLLVQKKPELRSQASVKSSVSREYRRELESQPGYIPEPEEESVFAINLPRGNARGSDAQSSVADGMTFASSQYSVASSQYSDDQSAVLALPNSSQAARSESSASGFPVGQAQSQARSTSGLTWSERKKQEPAHVPAHFQGEVTSLSPAKAQPNWASLPETPEERAMAVGSQMEYQEPILEKQKKAKLRASKSFHVSYHEATDEGDLEKKKSNDGKELSVESRYKLQRGQTALFDNTALSKYHDLDYLHAETPNLNFIDRLPERNTNVVGK